MAQGPPAAAETIPQTERKFLRQALLWAAVLLSLFQIWAVLFSTMDPLLHRAVFLFWVMALAFTGTRAYRSQFREGPRWFDLAPAALSVAAGVYFISQFDRILYRWSLVDALTPADLFFGAVSYLLVLELTRRIVGWAVFTIAIVFSLYVLAGHLLPGTFSHRLFSAPEFIDQMVYTINGIFGAPLAVAATYVYLFILFGVALFHSGAGEFFMGVAQSVAARSRGGAAKMAVIACGLFGMFSGSATSDAVTTGTLTIPFMKRMGYKPADAGAIVAVSATGGGIMPPIMGSAAFLMAEFTGIRYVSIAVAALLPAVLYYLCQLSQIHFRALGGAGEILPDEERGPSVRQLLLRHWPFLIPIAGLTWLLLSGATPTKSAGVAFALTLGVSWFRKESRIGWRKLATLLEETARAVVVVVAATASAGILVGAFGITGLGGKFSGLLFQVAGQTVLPALLITMVICLILGMGMPTPSAYILTAVVAVPALLRLGIPTLGAHMFVLYFACMSAITPPVAVAAFAAAGIAGADPNRVGFKALRLGIVAFIVPFIFVYQPALLMQGAPLEVMMAAATSVIGVIALAAGLEGWLMVRAAMWQRLMLVGGGLLMVVPGIATDGGGILLIGTVAALHWRAARASRTVAIGPAE